MSRQSSDACVRWCTVAVAPVAEPCVNRGYGSLCSHGPAELPSARLPVGKGISVSRMKDGSVAALPQ